MYYVFFTNELCNKKNQMGLFGQQFDKKPFVLSNYNDYIGENGKTYLKQEEYASCEGCLAVLTTEQLWILDQWMDIPLVKRTSIKVKYEGNTIDLYFYISNRQGQGKTSHAKADIDEGIASFQSKQKINAFGLSDLHLIYPCSFDKYDESGCKASIIGNANDPCINPYRMETQEEMDQYEMSEYFTCKLSENSNYEFNDAFITNIQRIPLGTIKCSFTYGEEEYVEYGFAYMSRHCITAIGTFSIVFTSISNPVILQLYAFCENMLNVYVGEDKIEVTKWLNEKHIEMFGYPKAIVFSYNTKVEKQDILKCLAFELEPIDEICSKKLNEWAEDNIAQYDLAEVYASDRCMLEIRKDIDLNTMTRLKAQAVEIFFIEILLFQEAAISRVCSRVSYYLNFVFNNADNNSSSEILFDLSKEMANAIMFIDHKRLRYPSVRISSKNIAERFGLPEELDKYYKYREILDEMISLNSNEQDKIEGSLMNFLLLVLTMIQVIPTLKEFAEIVITGTMTLQDGISLAISLSTCVLFYQLYRLFRWKTIKKLTKNRNERRKIYEK